MSTSPIIGTKEYTHTTNLDCSDDGINKDKVKYPAVAIAASIPKPTRLTPRENCEPYESGQCAHVDEIDKETQCRIESGR